MNHISEQLLSAMEIVADQKISQLKYDKTIRAVVYAIDNVDKGVYQVRYEGNIFSVYAQDITKKYQVDDEVYVKVPEGDFSNKKILTGKVNETSLSYSLLNQLANSVIEISPTFDKFYNYANPEAGIIAGLVLTVAKRGILYIYGNETTRYSSNQYHGLFQLYANQYEYIRIKASFKTQFHKQHIKGNYGIEVGFYAKSEDGNNNGLVTYRLDFESFNGDPYSYSVFSPQQLVFKVQKNYLLGLKYIKFFQEDFEYDSQVVDYETGARRNIMDVPNIFVQDIEVAYVDVVDLTAEMYYAYIAIPKGSIFSNTTSTIDLQARLLSYGEPVNENKCSFQWFKRDLSVTISDPDYNKNVGFGWRPLNDEKGSLLTIRNDGSVIYELRYKCLIIYNDDVTMTAEKEVLNGNANYGYHIELITDGSTIRLLLINDKNSNVLKGNWYISYPDGSYMEFSGGRNKNYIEVESTLTYTSVVFYCEVFAYDSTTDIAGTIEHTIFNSESSEDVSITYVGEDTFRYDSNGDVTIEDSEKERTLLVLLAWKEGFGTSYRVEWLGPDGHDIPTSKPTSENDGYKPENSMMLQIWIDTSNILHYNIKLKFKVNYNNNTFTVKIITIDEKVYVFEKEILFIKDGDQGTNGTTYIATIRPCDNNGTKLSGFQALQYTNGWENVGKFRLRCYLYKDGVPIYPSNTNYSVTYKWEYTNLNLYTITAPKTLITTDHNVEQVIVQGKGVISTASAAKDLERYVRVSVRINDKMNDNTTMIYATYPVDVVVGGLTLSSIDVDSIPSYIKYTASGINPSFYSNNIIFKYGNTDYTTGVSSLSQELVKVEKDNKDGLYYLKPATSFIFENKPTDSTIGVLKCQVTSTRYIIHPIMMYLDTYGNEAINGWDGTKLAIDDNGQYIYAPQVGAGSKDSYNRFTGVVMGKDSVQKMEGLYGYDTGINTFGLRKDGFAYFGIAGSSGRIEINGTKGTITAGNYKKDSTSLIGQGMMIDLPKGHIDAYNFLITSRNMTLNSNTGSFEFRLGVSGDSSDTDTDRDKSKFRIYFPKGTHNGVTITSDKNVFYVDKDEYYLLTLDFTAETSSVAGKGTKVDLAKGKITSYDFHIKTPTLTIDSGSVTTGNSKFEYNVVNKGTFDIYTTPATGLTNAGVKMHLIYAQGDSTTGASEDRNSGKFYLQSLNYVKGTSGMKIDLIDGHIYSATFKLTSNMLDIDADKGQFVFYLDNSSSNSYFRIYNRTKNSTDSAKLLLFNISQNSYYFLSLGYKTGTPTTNGVGTKIDLYNGKITSYSFHLDTPYLTIKSSLGNASGNKDEGNDTDGSGQFVFNVYNGGEFKVQWDSPTTTAKNLIYIKGTAGVAPTSTANSNSDSADTGSFYLQSYDYNTGSKKGMKINLATGKITSYVFKLETTYLTMSSDNTGTFDLNVAGKGNFRIRDGSNNLIYILGTDSRVAGTATTVSGGEGESVGAANSGSFYIQSHDYSTSSKTGTRIDLVNGRITSYVFTLKTAYIDMSSDSSGIFSIDVTNSGKFQIKDSGSSGNKTLMYVGGGRSSTYYLQSSNYSRNGDDVTGVYINLSSGTSYFGGTITADAGKIGGWRITTSGLSNGDNIYLYSNGSMKVGDNFAVTSTGVLTAKGGNFEGTITADAGKIGGWTITALGLSNGDDIYIKSGGYIKMGGLSITSSGTSINGTVTASAGSIGGWTISTNRLTSGSIYLDSSDGTISGAKISGGTVTGATISGGSLSIGSRFDVTTNGLLSAADATLSAVTIKTAVVEASSGLISFGTQTLGTLGYIAGSAGAGSITSNIGIKAASGHSVILEAPSGDIRIGKKIDNNTIWLEGELRFDNATFVDGKIPASAVNFTDNSIPIAALNGTIHAVFA